MVHHFFGASVLERTTNVATGSDKAYLVKHSFSASGLSFNPKNDPEQRAQSILEDKLKDEDSLIRVGRNHFLYRRKKYTNVPVHEVLELACEALYASKNPPELQQPTFKKLMELAVTNVWFMSGSDWYIQRDGVAMGASLAVILANIWLKKF